MGLCGLNHLHDTFVITNHILPCGNAGKVAYKYSVIAAEDCRKIITDFGAGLRCGYNPCVFTYAFVFSVGGYLFEKSVGVVGWCMQVRDYYFRM